MIAANRSGGCARRECRWRRCETSSREPAGRSAQRTAVHRQARRTVHDKQQLEHFRFHSQQLKRDLMVEVDRTVTHMKDEAANFPDPNDAPPRKKSSAWSCARATGTQADPQDRRRVEAHRGRLLRLLLETGEEIGIKRLEARPVATLSIEAQERRERRERQYGDRDDRYR